MTGHRLVERPEDASPAGRLMIIVQPDGDVLLTTVTESIAGNGEHVGSLEFREAGVNGGRSPNTVRVLRELADAMELDNAKHPIGRQEMTIEDECDE